MRDHRSILGRQIRSNGDRRASQMQAVMQSVDMPVASRRTLPAESDLADLGHNQSGDTKMPIQRARRAQRRAARPDRVSPLLATTRHPGRWPHHRRCFSGPRGRAYLCRWSHPRLAERPDPRELHRCQPAGLQLELQPHVLRLVFGHHDQNVALPAVQVTCAPGGTKLDFPLAISSAKLNVGGSFSVSQSQKGDYAGYPATFKIAMSGQAGAAGAGGQPTMAGALSETVTYSNGTKFSCPSGTLSWTAIRDASQSLTTGAPPIGSYTGASPQGLNSNYNFTYDVSSKQTALQDVSFPAVDLTCSPGDGVPSVPVVLDSVPLAANGSFTTSQTQAGDYNGFPATFKTAFAGNFHGLNSSGLARAAGDLTETMTYTAGGTNYSCTSNQLAFAAAYDANQTVTTGKPPVGSYTGASPQGLNSNYNFTAYVSGNGNFATEHRLPGHHRDLRPRRDRHPPSRSPSTRSRSRRVPSGRARRGTVSTTATPPLTASPSPGTSTG